MRSLTFFICLLVTFLGNHIAWATPCQTNGVLCETLKPNRGEIQPTQICVLSSDGFEPIWYLLFGHGLPERLEKVPDSMFLVNRILLSPSQQFLAIASAGEGHPYLTVVELAPLLQKETTNTLATVNPYPGWVNLVGWEGKKDTERLVVESDRLLSEQNQDLYQSQKFAVEVKSGKIKALSLDLQQVIPYYIKLLRRPAKSSDDIVETLASVARLEKLSLLQQAFEQETNSVVKAKLAKAIEIARRGTQQ